MITSKIRNKTLIKVLAILSVAVVPLLQSQHAAYAEKSSSQVTVTASDLNVRENPGISSKIINLVHFGDTFDVIQTKNNWNQIKLLKNQTGWVYNAYVTSTENIEATVEASSLNVRANPSLSSNIVSNLKLRTKITIQLEQAGWAKIVAPTGVSGWVNENYITKNVPRSHQIQSISSIASQNTNSDTTEDKESSPTSNESSRTLNSHMTHQSKDTGLVQNNQEPLKGKIIVLDPGHGGKDDGTTSYDGTREKTLTLAIAKLVEQKLENSGANVIMTRTDDTFIPLEQRAAFSNQNHAEAFISFHYNWSSDPSVNGITDFYFRQSSNPLASDIINEVVKATGLNNIGTKFDNLSVLRNNIQPSTLIELGFLSSRKDTPVVESDAYREKVAQGVYQGLLEFFSNK